MSHVAKIQVVVTPELRAHILGLKQGTTWRALAGKIDGWRWSPTTLADIANRRQEFVNLEIYQVLGVQPPVVPITLENVNVLQISEPALAHFLQRAKLQECAVEKCNEHFYKIGSAKYCAAHSWATLEGRRWHRRQANQKAPPPPA